MTNDQIPMTNEVQMTNDQIPMTNEVQMTNDQIPMTNEIPMTKIPNKKYDLRERTAKFGEGVIIFAKNIPENGITRPLVSQLVRAGTSIGANYCEADDASTRKDFFYKIGTCRRESKECKHWLRMVTTAVPALRIEAEALLNEAQELNLIFSAIIKRSKNK